MVCEKCGAENEANRKFCSSCGNPLGLACDRCGAVNGVDDSFCGRCGFALAASVTKGSTSSVPTRFTTQNAPQEYSPADLEEILSLRRSMEKMQSDPETLDQEEIDRLFD
jgi:ribosomal protein L40E